MKYFGEYLVEQGIITIDSLVESLIEQVRDVPTIIEIVHRKKALAPNSLLDVMKAQQERRIDFRSACSALGMWNAELEKLVEVEIKTARVPLGQIIVRKGLADLSTITKALDEFLSKIETPPKAPAAFVAVPMTVENASAAEVAVGQGISDGAASGIDPVFIEEFKNSLSGERLDQMRNLFNGLEMVKGSKDVLMGVLKDIFAETRMLRGQLHSVHLFQFESIVVELTSWTERVMQNANADQVPDLQPYCDAGNECVNALEVLVKFIGEKSHEAAVMADAAFAKSFAELKQCMTKVN